MAAEKDAVAVAVKDDDKKCVRADAALVLTHSIVWLWTDWVAALKQGLTLKWEIEGENNYSPHYIVYVSFSS